MKVINKKMCVVILLVMIEISSLFLMYKSNSNKEIKLDSIENKIEDNNLFALMVEQTLGTYTTSSSTTWPTGYVLNTLKSGCVDNEGNKIKDGMRYDKTNNKVIVKTNKTSNCYVYLSKSTYDRVLASSQIWKTDRLSNDGYRYYGDGTTVDSSTDPANYVCFGTQDRIKCVSDTDKYMYRIIGMFQEETTSGGYNVVNSSSDYHLKLIKKEALNTTYKWADSDEQDVKWIDSKIYKGINGNYFVTNMDYYYMQEDFWYSKIMNWKWNAANTNRYYDTNTGRNKGYSWSTIANSEVYLDELNREGKSSSSITTYETVTSKIGLMYLMDYRLSLGSVSKDYLGSNYTLLKKGWMYLENNDSATLSTSNQAPVDRSEYTLSLFGVTGIDRHDAFVIDQFGTAGGRGIDSEISIRPVFYLNSDVVICAGTGTSTDPYILG